MGKKVKIGNDRQPAPLITENVPLYNLSTGQALTDEGGTPLVSAEDTFLTSEATSSKATSLVYTNDKAYNQTKNIKISGQNFSAVGSIISAASGSRFKGEFKYKIIFSSTDILLGLSEGTVLTNRRTGESGEVLSLSLNEFNTGGFLIISDYESTIFSGDLFDFGTETISSIQSFFVGKAGELSSGDRLLLPTGLDGSTKVYEVRTIKEVIDNQTLELSLNVTSNVNLFGELIKLQSIRVDPVLQVEEQFPTFSEVSTTILGYPKAEEQLGLFSNVSTYGLDEDEFIFYQNDAFSSPSEWENRKNKTYGNHYGSRYREIGDEAAIAIESYRVPYSYPYGPNERYGYQQENFKKFNTFLKLGALLYDTFKESNPSYANNFLPYIPNHVVLDIDDTGAGLNAQVDNIGNYLNYFIPGEQIIISNTAEVIGTVKSFNMNTKVLHFNEEIGYILEDRNVVQLPIAGVQSGSVGDIVGDMTFSEPEDFFTSFVTPLNPFYSSTDDFFAQVDTWTETYRKILRGDIDRPNGSPLDSSFIQNLALVQKYIVTPLGTSGAIASNDNTRPGYSTGQVTRAYLESRKAFRYQPGRISGYTFGVRASNDARDDNNVIIEWGIGNNTDDLVFQIRGSTFSIVRRSVVPLSEEVLSSNSLEVSDQVLIEKDTQNNEVFTGLENKEVWETVISRDRWNGDKLDGNGPSGYLWKAENVTMYKIEFGWYGAIGIQFYAYVPVENGEARWVKLHRLIIENKLNQPCMGDPYFKFKYSLITLDHINVKTPQYIYKYGTSCYIDGGDEGTLRIYSATSEPKTAPVEIDGAPLSTSLVAIQPKTVIYNSTGTAIKNKMQVFPKELSVQSTGLTEVSIVKCKSCPGFGHTYQPNLSTGYNGDVRIFDFPATVSGYDRSRVDLRLLTKGITASSGAGGFTITLDSVEYIRVGDVVDPNNIFADIPQQTLITAIDTDTNEITLSNALVASVSGSIEIQPVFLESDLYSKVIGGRLYLTYIWEYDTGSLVSIAGQEDRYKTALLGTIDTAAVLGDQDLRMPDYLIERELPETYRVGDTIVPFPTSFTGRLSQYKALAASSVPVIGRKNSLLFLMTDSSDTGPYSDGQYADFRVGVTSLRPEFDGVNTINWYDSLGVQQEFTDDYKLYAERFNEGVGFDIDGFETGETRFGRIQPFLVDYRIPNPPGSNTGRCSFLNITVNDAEFIECQQIRGDNLPAGDIQPVYPSFNSNAFYLRTSSFPFTFNPQNAEIGFNENDPTGIDEIPTVGSGVYFNSDVITYTDSSSGITYQLIEITNNLPNQTDPTSTTVVVWYVPISLETYRKLATKSFNFNPFPIYFFVELRDGSRLNGAVIKEEGQINNTYNPRWFFTEEMSVTNDSIQVGTTDNVFTTTGDLTQSPPNFVDKKRLSSALIDTQNQSQLRPYEVVDKIYVGQDTKSISLDSIFDRDKETITPDLLNTTAYFFLATSKETDPNNERSIQATLTYVEQ